MENETHPQIETVAAQLAEEIAFTHDAIMAVHKFAGQGGDPKVQLDCMKAAARLMQAQAAAALSLQRLTGNAQSFTIIHEKRAATIPTPEKSKTNGGVKGANVREFWEDEETGEFLPAPKQR